MFSNLMSFIAGILVYHVLLKMNEREQEQTVIPSVGVFNPITQPPLKRKKKNAKVQGNTDATI
jgi:hypothetical protein